MFQHLLFSAQISGADRLVSAQKYMNKSSFSFDDYAVFIGVLLIMAGFGFLVAAAYFKQKEKHKNMEE